MTAIAESAVVIRPAVETDVALIYSSWLRSYWNAKPAALVGVEYESYVKGQRARIGRLLAAHGACIACSPEAPDTIMGWAVLSGDHGTLHYTYTRHPYRRMGIANSLLTLDALLPAAATHMTAAFARCFPRVPFNPYLLEQT